MTHFYFYFYFFALAAAACISWQSKCVTTLRTFLENLILYLKMDEKGKTRSSG
jgi:hypothetical protein